MPLLATTLLLVNGRSKWVGQRLRNRPLASALLAATILLFLVLGYLELHAQLVI
jgi:hypothetical protein